MAGDGLGSCRVETPALLAILAEDAEVEGGRAKGCRRRRWYAGGELFALVHLLPKAIHGLDSTTFVCGKGGRRDGEGEGLVESGEVLDDLLARETRPLG
jgi:hypothetical protein